MIFPISDEFADRFSKQWADAWNSHDMDRILAFYSDDIVFGSPMIAGFRKRSSNFIQGKEALQAYGTWCFEAAPDLYFSPAEKVIAGEKDVCLIYRGVHDLMAVEFMIFNEQGLICRSECQYRESAQLSAGNCG